MALFIFPDFRFAEKCMFFTTPSIVGQTRKAQYDSGVAEALLQVAVYGGVPAANTALRIATEIFREIKP
jgi:hypothetical protein